MKTISWVTDPHHPEISPIQQDLLSALAGPRFKIISSSIIELDRGLTRANYSVEELPGEEKIYGQVILPVTHPINGIKHIIIRIGFVPVTISMVIENILPNESILNGLSSIIKALTEKILLVEVNNVQITPPIGNPAIIYFSLMGIDYPIYEDHRYLPDLLLAINPDQLLGYQVLSADPLTSYVINLYQREIGSFPPDMFTTVKGITLIKVTEEDDYLQYLQEKINDLRIRGYFVLPPDVDFIEHDPLRLLLYPEIARLWGGTIMETSPYLVLSSNVDFGTEVENWYQSAAEQILLAGLPKFRIKSKKWNKLHLSNEELQVRVAFAATKAYLRITQQNLILIPFIFSPQVLSNLDIEAMFSSYDDANKYRQILDDEFADQVLHYRTFLIQSGQIDDGVIFRWYFYRKAPDLKSFMVRSDDERLHLIVDESTVEAPTLENLEESRVDLIKDFRSQVTYCFASDNIRRWGYLINPMTRTPLDEETISYLNYLEYGLMGYFSVGPIPGLLAKPPQRYLISPPAGSSIVTKMVPGGSSSSLLDPIFTVEVSFLAEDFLPVSLEERGEDDAIFHLFDLTIEDPRETVTDELNILIPKLWNCGWLLSSWATSLVERTGKMSRVPFSFHPNLVQAEEVGSGERGLNTLRLAGQQRCGIPLP